MQWLELIANSICPRVGSWCSRMLMSDICFWAHTFSDQVGMSSVSAFVNRLHVPKQHLLLSFEHWCLCWSFAANYSESKIGMSRHRLHGTICFFWHKAVCRFSIANIRTLVCLHQMHSLLLLAPLGGIIPIQQLCCEAHVKTCCWRAVFLGYVWLLRIKHEFGFALSWQDFQLSRSFA